jgi:hypothetical protein
MKLRDYKIKPLHQFYRPYFSPYTNSYEIDWITAAQNNNTRLYFACININTKYLYMKGLDTSATYTSEATYNCIKEIQEDLIAQFGNEAKIKRIRADGAREFEINVTSTSRVAERILFGQDLYTRNVFTS